MDSKTLIATIQEWLHLKSKAVDEGRMEPPMPVELFSADQMERYGITLALSHELVEKTAPDMLLSRLSASEANLKKACEILSDKSNYNNGFSPAKEWLLDNFYLIQEQIHSIRRHLPKGYGRSLPQLAGNIPGYPRIYDIALQIIEHGDGRWDLENLNRFLSAYQSVTALTLGELWAVPITLGVALIDNLSSAARRIVAEKNDRDLADYWAEKMTASAVSDPKKIVLVIADMARSNPPMSSAFVAELSRKLRGAALALPLNWVEQHLAEEGLSIALLVQEENKQQAANQVSVSNSIAGLRHLSEVDWRDFVENMSVVEKTLKKDPTGTYSKMDFGTRDRYRHVIERLSKATAFSETEVADITLKLAQEKWECFSKEDCANSEVLRYAHIGYYLIDKGLPKLKQSLNFQYSLWQKITRISNRNSLKVYLGSIFGITALLIVFTLLKATETNLNIFWLFWLIIIIIICGSQLAVGLVNLFATLLVKPEPLPRMDFATGIPAAFRTLVVVPTMLSSPTGIETLVEALEVRFLGNRDKNLLFGLLTDFNDAKTEQTPEDSSLLLLAKERIEALNTQYASDGSPLFFLFQRPRQWNENEQAWMGWERKRGKLTDLNNLLRSDNEKPFSLIIGNTALLKTVKYVITLDSDTQLSRESARQLVATMAHPLNRPCYDASKNTVIDGYGILQPRIAEAIPDQGPTRYVWLYGNDFGIDPYTRTISDVYQDLFQEGSFIGKGIYDVDLFQQVLGNRFPNNQILSHDLLEGCYLRSGLVSDIPLYEKTPNCYLIDTKRRVRWIRGDWQLTPWLYSKVLNSLGKTVPNPLSFLSKWKLIDNLRRSLVPIALLSLLIINWTLLPENAFWLDLILAIILLPAIINTLLELLYKPKDTLTSQHISNIIPTIRKRSGQLLFYLACLPFEAWYSFLAIFRTEWRMQVSKQHLLEWVPSDQVNRCFKDTAKEWMLSMWVGPAFAILAIVMICVNDKLMSLIFSLPLLLLWFSSPLIAQWLSQPLGEFEPLLDESQNHFLHIMARKTWDFFETFINEENHWLPPDNYQETPIAVLARRTSPTNMGLALLANLTAYDFGYITRSELFERTNLTLQTMKNLERYHTHFYNWYSTETLKPLHPRYVSAVDSGNLAGHLLTLRQGLLEVTEEPLLNTRYLNGLRDTCRVLESLSKQSGKFSKSYKALDEFLTGFMEVLERAEASQSFNDKSSAEAICEELLQIAKEGNIRFELEEQGISIEVLDWLKKLLKQCVAIQKEIYSEVNYPDLTPLIFSLAQMDVGFLYKPASHLMSIGFNVETQKLDNSSYDLLSSEARMGTFVAIAQGQVLQESWFALGRLMVSSGGEPILLSWSGSMFEYLMPLLVMPTYPGTLLDQTYSAAVTRQIAHGKRHNVPWGVSESGYNAIDTQFNYLYRAFGVPGLGLKRGLEEDLVIAPYASAMALMVAPGLACQNLQRLASEHASGQYGFYEAIDYTAARLPRDNRRAIVRSFMTHHQGMAFLAFSYVLHDKPMQRRFMADPLFQATLLLLQERIPKPNASYLKIPKSPEANVVSKRPEISMRVFNNPNTRTPQVQLLSNGRLHSVLTQAGGSYTRWKEFALTRWREDTTSDNWGLFSYVRDVATGGYCSTIYQPTNGSIENFKAVFSEGHAEFNRRALLLDLHTEVVISPEDDIELRRLRIHNKAKHRRIIEFTSYGEIVLSPQAADIAQPAFNNLFVETEILADAKAILATRRPQDEKQKTPWLLHLLNVYGEKAESFSYETDRARFIGRSRNLSEPEALIQPGDLSNTKGAVLDPIFAIRCRIILEADALVTVDMLTGAADTKTEALDLVEKYRDKNLANRIFGLAWTHGQVLLHQLNITEADAQHYVKLASAIIYMNHNRRADPRIMANNRKGQSGLWGYSISGDLPIVLVQIEDAANIDLVRQFIQGHAYWRRKGLIVDLVIINKERMSYRATLQEQIMSLITANTTVEHLGSILVRNADQVSNEDMILLQSVSRIVFSDRNGNFRDQVKYRRINPKEMTELNPSKKVEMFSKPKPAPLAATLQLGSQLQFFNSMGGFNSQGNEYVIHLQEDATPAPWANVIANPRFGTLVSECGQGYTWAENAHEYRLTPWNNDPIQDSSGEAFYIRDDETGEFWSPTVLPCRGRGDYLTRHGFGYSLFEHKELGLHSELCVTVPMDATIKLSLLKIRNDSEQYRSLSVMGYIAWVLGDTPTKNAMHVMTELGQNGAILAQNCFNSEFANNIAFFDVSTQELDLNGRSISGDRTEVLGRNGSMQKPEAMSRKRLSGRVGAGLDPCAAIQLSFDLAPGKTREMVFVCGAAKDKQEAEDLLHRFYGSSKAEVALQSTKQFWQKKLGTIKVSTPDPALNLLANGWLLYQVLSSRLWGRSGYYQSSGAFGYRDQLQDVMSLSIVAPEIFRAHILLCALHQFEQGDVQHWWHPPTNRGLRTRCSDDFLWLPFAICQYIETTGDMDILNEKMPFLQGRPLNSDEESYYDLPPIGQESSTLYQHAVRAINHGLRFGEHGLPLMGSGDWNDGMNLVGIEGKGESVWLGFFLYNVLKRFAKLAARYEDKGFADRCNTEANKLKQHIEQTAWDGDWYRRAYFDDGTALGSIQNHECKIDSIAQSWSVLSGASDPIRAKKAMDSLYQHLVNKEDGIIKLLDPPFDKSKPNPGYIEGYVPGIRENGGQYTHAAIWAAMAFAELDEKTLAWQLFQMINPINHGRTQQEINRYKIEPYVIAGDVYSVAPHVGRGGWSWYTGSAGWLYRLITETLLGIHLIDGNRLFLKPLMPEDWEEFSVDYYYGEASTLYKIKVMQTENNKGNRVLVLDGVVLENNYVILKDDGKVHEVILAFPQQ